MILLFFFVCVVCMMNSASAWWNTNWHYSKEITIDHDQVDEILYGFPVLVNVTDTDVRDKAQPDGDDIVFVSSDNLTQFPHEIEYYNNSNGRLVCWVNVSTVSNTTNTSFYMYYGNPSCSDQQDVSGTWDQYYVGVWHMAESSGNIVDSTGNNNHGVVHGTPDYDQDGWFGRTVHIDANSEYFQVSNSNSMDISDNITVNSVFRQDASTDESDYLISTRSGEKGFWIRIAHGGDDGEFEFATGNSSLQAVQTSGTYTSTSEWYNTIGTYNRSAANERRLWVIGHEQQSTADVNEFGNSNSDWYIGNYIGSSYSMDGYLEELRVSSIVRSDAWIRAGYNNMANSTNSSANSFFTMGNENNYGNSSPVISVYNPVNGSTVSDISSINVSVYISDAEGDLFNYTIETSPDIGHRYGNLTGNGTKEVNVSSPVYGTTYTVYVNATDPYGSGNWTNISYSFTVVGGLEFWCYNENNMSQTIGFDLIISNQQGTQVYSASDLTSGSSINTSVMPVGLNTVFIVSNSSYETRVYYYDITVNTYLNLSFYLPPVKDDVTLQYSSEGVSDPASNVVVDLECVPDRIVLVQGWNESLYGHWFMIPDDNYTLAGDRVTVSSDSLDANTTVIQVQYYCSDNVLDYIIHVIDNVNNPVSDAKVLLRRLDNDTYMNMSSVITDGNGDATVFLIPGEHYRVVISKDGYDTSYADYIPSESIRTKTYQLVPETPDTQDPDSILENIMFNGHIAGGVLYVNYTDSTGKTVNTSVHIFEVNHSSTNTTIFHYDNRTGNQNFQVTVSVNTSNTYHVVLYLNHSVFGFQTLAFTVHGVITTATDQTTIDTVLELLFGNIVFGATNFILWVFCVMGFFYADYRDRGIVMILMGGLLLFFNYMIGFNTTLTYVAGGAIPVLLIVVGVIVSYGRSSSA